MHKQPSGDPSLEIQKQTEQQPLSDTEYVVMLANMHVGRMPGHGLLHAGRCLITHITEFMNCTDDATSPQQYRRDNMLYRSSLSANVALL